jgi:uncharacterized protein (TIGR03437 family)
MKIPWLILLLAVQAFGTLSNPPLLVYSTYLNGTNESGANGIAIDSAGNAYISGITTSSDFPFTLPPIGPPVSNNICNFVTKLNPSGTAIIWSVCLTIPAGGPIVVDASGAVYVGGNNTITGAVTKLTPNGDAIIWSTNIASAYPLSLALDAAGNVYVAGTAGPGLATTPGAYQTQYTAGYCSDYGPNVPCNDGFAAKLDPTGRVVYSTYLATSGSAQGIALDSQTNAWITGGTSGGGAFVLKLDSAGAKFLFSKYFAGPENLEETSGAIGLGIVVDSQDSAYAVGGAGYGVPTTPDTVDPNGPFQQSIGDAAGYVLKFKSTGDIVYGTYLGDDYASISAVAVDAKGNAYFGLNDQIAGLYCSTHIGSSVMVLNPDGSKILSSAGIAAPTKRLLLDGKGGVFISGTTYAEIFVSTPHAFQTLASRGSNAFAAKFDFSQPAGLAFTCLVNAANMTVGLNNPRDAPDGSVAPGELVTLFGTGFSGPGLKVTFDGFPAPVTYADSGQINAVVPFEAGQANHPPTTLVSVQMGSQTYGPVELPVAPAMPAIFTVGPSNPFLTPYVTQAAALNQDGSINSSANPAPAGSVVAVFMTGVGEYNPPLPDGSLGPLKPPFPTPVIPMSALVNSEPAEVLFAGQAPALIAGVVQVNVRIPRDIKSGPATLGVAVGQSYGAIATVAIR